MITLYRTFNGVAFVVTIVINYLSNTGVFAGETMSSISDNYKNLFTPAGYAFSIWGIIYLGLLGFVIYYGPFFKPTPQKDAIISKIGPWFIISCICNCLWIIAWLNDILSLSVILMIILFFALSKIVINNNYIIQKQNIATRMLFGIPFQIYFGWVTVALIANIASYLTKLQWNGFGFPAEMWTIIMILIATLLHLFILWKKRLSFSALVLAWALTAISIANGDKNQLIYLSAIIGALLILINLLVYNYRAWQLERK